MCNVVQIYIFYTCATMQEDCIKAYLTYKKITQECTRPSYVAGINIFIRR